MDTKIFLKGFDSKKSVNTSEGLNVKLKGKRKLLPTNDVSEVISLNDQYIEERGACNIIRLTCEVNPICSNVLYNKVSEIVKDEGSSELSYINYRVLKGEIRNDDNRAYVDYGEDEGKLKYKKREISFWNSDSFKYQSTDTSLSNLRKDDALSAATRLEEHYSNGSVTSNSSHSTNAIRDMQLSNCGYVYHCGLDIMNNHLIRSKSFKCVCKMPDSNDYNDKYGAFNTIADLMRDVNGKKIVEKLTFPIGSGIDNDMKFTALHLYKYDEICSFEECRNNRLLETFNGWVGFKNRPKIKTYEIFSINHLDRGNEQETELHIERPIMYLNGGDFVDMYPDRTLYSFVPKFNHFKNRLEKNWNYCLTYPSSSTTQGFEDIIETSNNSLKAIYFDENTKNDNGVSQLVVYSIVKHGLVVGDYVNIYINTTDENGNIINTKIIDNAKVVEADNHIFVILNPDIQISNSWTEITRGDFTRGNFVVDNVVYVMSSDRKTCHIDGDVNKEYYIINNRYVNIDDGAQNMSFKKVVNDIECEYYIRIFSKIPNFKNASVDTSNEYQLYKDGAATIHTYQDKKYDFESHVSRLAFAKNIYTDEVGEVVFTDDINIANLKDNLGRPLSSIYLTIVKNNKGYKEWYGFDKYDSDDNDILWVETEITSDGVEYSHCFGKITCGIETSEESTCNNTINSINKISNSPNNGSFGYNIDNINYERRYNEFYDITENEIWFDTDKHYYGDLCYYDNYNALEISIQNIMHRFNTAQRESSLSQSSKYYTNFVYDEIIADDYDVSDYNITAHTESGANDLNEGYYYNPHYEIPIRTFGKPQTMYPDFLKMRSIIKIDDSNTYRITTLQDHYLTLGDKSIIYDALKNKYYYCTTIIDKSSTYKTFVCKVYDEYGKEVNDLMDIFNSSDSLKNYKLFKMDNLNIPSYANVLKDGSCRIIWRDIINNGLDMNNKTIEEYPFTNGAFYINRRIDLFVKRQDPFEKYGLYNKRDLSGMIYEQENYTNYYNEGEIEC